MNRMLLMLVILVFGVSQANAQSEYILETRGDTLVVANFFDADFAANTLGTVIQNDADAPEGRVYLLKSGANGDLESANMSLHLQTGAIPATGRHLTIVGEFCGLMVQGDDETCRPPTVSGYVPEGGGGVLTVQADGGLTLKNLHITSAHNDGAANWSLVDVTSPNTTINFENVLAEHNLWVFIQSNQNRGTEVNISDSYFLNATDQVSRRNGGVFDADVPVSSVKVENSTHVQMAGMQYKFRNFSPEEVVFNRNTFVNAAGQVFLGFGYLTHFVATNNLFVNSNFLPYYPGLDNSEMWAANTEPEEYQPHGLINLAPLPVNSAGQTYVSAVDDSLFAEAERRVLVDGNAVYWDSRLLDIADDLNADGVEGDVCVGDGCIVDEDGEPIPEHDWSSQAILANERTQAMFNDRETYPLFTWGRWYENGDPGFAQMPDMIDGLLRWAHASVHDTPANSELMPKLRSAGNQAGLDISEDYDTWNWITFDWPVIVDLSYSNPEYLSGGYNGTPVGDLNWFPEQKEAWLANRDAEYDAIENALDNGETLVSVVDLGGRLPGALNLRQNYPNPFVAGEVTNIAFEVSQAGNVSISVYDALGRQVTTLVNENLAAGNYSVEWNGTDGAGRTLSSGVYFYSLRTGDQVESKRMVIVR